MIITSFEVNDILGFRIEADCLGKKFYAGVNSTGVGSRCGFIYRIYKRSGEMTTVQYRIEVSFQKIFSRVKRQTDLKEKISEE